MIDMFVGDVEEPQIDETNPTTEADKILPDGIYFNMVEKTYFGLERLSASAIKAGLISMPTLWAKSWMNPDRDDDVDDKSHQIIGRAYHAAFFEPETLNERYAGKPDFFALKDLLTTDTAVKAELKAMGLAQTKSGEVALERAQRLKAAGCEKPILSILEAEYSESVGHRVSIDPATWKQIQIDLARVQNTKELFEIVEGGAAEVTILWTCRETGIKMKSRLDKLRLHDFTDLKSFVNSNGKPTPQAIRDATQYNRYYLSMRLYQTAISEIWKQDLQIQDAATGDQKQLISNIKDNEVISQPYFIFQEKGGIPNIYRRRLNLQRFPDGVSDQSIGAEGHKIKKSPSALCMKADIEIAEIKRRFLQCIEIFGADGQEWTPLDMVGEFNDEDFSGFFLDELPS